MAADVGGVWGIVVASVLFPATIAAAPLLALVGGQWLPALVVYGGGSAAGLLMAWNDPAREPGACPPAS
jgi:hypothetical protein